MTLGWAFVLAYVPFVLMWMLPEAWRDLNKED